MKRWLEAGLVMLLCGCGTVAPHQQAAGGLSAKTGPAPTSAVTNVTVALQPGWNGVAFQCQKVTSLSATPGVVGTARWTGSAYVTGNLTAGEINARQALWVLANTAANLTYSGVDDGTGNFVDLTPGYQLVSFCSSSPVPGSGLTASSNGQPVPLASAVLPQFLEVGPGPAYTPVDVTAGGVLQPGRAYWVYASTSVRLALPATPAPSPSPLPAIVSLSLQPTDVSLFLTGTVQFTLTAKLADGTSRDVTSQASWSSADPSVAALLSPGLFKGLNPFPTRITAALGGQTVETGLVVSVQPTTVPPTPSPSPEPLVFVADQSRNRVVRMDGIAGAGNISQSLAGSGTAINEAHAVCLDSANRIYVADFFNNRIVRMDDMSGANNVSQTLAGSGASLLQPDAVFVDRANRIYVADAFNFGRVVRMDDMTGANNVSQNLAASGLQFAQPSGVAVDSSNRIYVADSVHGRIVRMDDMTGANNVSQTLAGSGTSFGTIAGLWLDAADRIYVGGRTRSRITRMDDMAGANNVSFNVPGGAGGPWGVSVDSTGRIYVAADLGLLRVDNMAGANPVIQTLTGGPNRFGTPHGVFVR